MEWFKVITQFVGSLIWPTIKEGNQGHILFSLTSTPLSGKLSIWQESHGLLQPVSPIM